MQITRVDVTPVNLTMRQPALLTGRPEASEIMAIFVRMETREGQTAWGCTVAGTNMTGEDPKEVLRLCQDCASLIPDLHPTNIEFSLRELESRAMATPGVLCAFDLAFHDLLSLAADMPLYRLLGGYRDRIQTSATIPISPVDVSVEIAQDRARHGFGMLKIKGGHDPGEDVQRVQAIHRALPAHILRLDADEGYSVQQALDVSRALEHILEMIEQPVAAGDYAGLRQVKEISPVPVLADQSVRGPASALDLAAHKVVDGLSIKLAACGGLRCARQVDAIARAAQISTMVGCFVEPALLISAGLSLALSSPNVHYGDLDGCFDLLNDPSRAGFRLEDGWLIASEVPGLAYSVEL